MIRCICLDDTNKPSVIPITKWVKKGKIYHIKHIYRQKLQNDIQGCALSEIDIDKPEYLPYNSFKLSRFAIHADDLSKLMDLAKLCTDLNDIDLEKALSEISVSENELEEA